MVKLAEGLNAARTGLTEEQAKAEGRSVVSVVCVSDDKAHYYPDSGIFITKLIADKESHKLLGMQVIGGGAVDKMADIAVTGISWAVKWKISQQWILHMRRRFPRRSILLRRHAIFW